MVEVFIYMRIPLAREGYPFIIPLAVLTAVVWYLDSRFAFYPIHFFFLALTCFVLWFFRDPVRIPPDGEDNIISPADGKVIKAERVMDDRFLKTEAIKISIFMDVFNVHVNRAPSSGRVVEVLYNPGKFINASFDKASLLNEQNAIVVETASGRRYVANQIAGLIARRIVCDVKENDMVRRGERFGLIRFGSRLDVFLPIDVDLRVKIGDKVSAGTSVLARWTS